MKSNLTFYFHFSKERCNFSPTFYSTINSLIVLVLNGPFFQNLTPFHFLEQTEEGDAKL